MACEPLPPSITTKDAHVSTVEMAQHGKNETLTSLNSFKDMLDLISKDPLSVVLAFSSPVLIIPVR